MKSEDFKSGDKVVTLDEPEDVGIVDHVDEVQDLIWVKFPIRGSLDHTSLDDVYPEDLKKVGT